MYVHEREGEKFSVKVTKLENFNNVIPYHKIGILFHRKCFRLLSFASLAI